ncbi:O-antigen ligase family protein [Neisseriaceae bacterium JH1-16]|nr:O-antigen ligase family protein [Neisseriaceae bacterium JH1-16]
MKNFLAVRQDCALFLGAIFLATANVPHTVALRYSILALMLLIVIADPARIKDFVSSNRQVVGALLLFFIWALLHTLAFSDWRAASFSELQGQLLVGVLFFFVGGALFTGQHPLSVIDLVICATVAVVFSEFSHGIHEYLQTGVFPYQVSATTSGKLEYTFFMNIGLTCMLVSLVVGGLLGFGPASRLPPWCLWVTVTLVLVTSLWAGARNGLIGLVYLGLSMLAVFLIVGRRRFEGKKVWGAGLLAAVALVSVTSYSVNKDPRWHSFYDSANMGFHYKTTDGWLTRNNYPLLPNGNVVDESAYERVAWISKGLDLILQNPLGFGYARDAFGYELKQESPKANVGHSHSGFIDLGVGLGWLGIALWLFFCGAMIYRGLVAFFRYGQIRGLILGLLCTGFLGRMVLDSVNKDHMLHMFLFIVGALQAELGGVKEKEEPLRSSIKRPVVTRS